MDHDHDAPALPDDWAARLGDELTKDYWIALQEFVRDDRAERPIYPPVAQTFAAFELTPYDDVKAVILGQDPYPNPGEAHGLAFSVPPGVAKPPSLRNIHAELETDLGVTAPAHGDLQAWAREGVLLLNTALTVRAGSKTERLSHRRWRHQRQGWTTFTDAVIKSVSAKTDRVVFLLWGADARRKAKLIDVPPHGVITSAHPSPLAAYRGFTGSRPFSRTNEMLRDAGRDEIDWAAIGPTPGPPGS